MWFATLSGMDRYDGYNVTRISGPELPDKRGPVGPAYAICEWSNRLWVGWDAYGVAWFDETTGAFRRPETVQWESSVTSLLPDGDSVLWVGTGRGLCRILNHDGAFIHSIPGTAVSRKVSGQFISGICHGPGGSVWVATLGGLFRWDRRKDSVACFGESGSPGTRLSSRLVQTIFQDESGCLWIGTHKGLDCYTDKAGITNALHGEDITSVAKAPDGELWLGTFDSGIIIFDPIKRTVSGHILPDAGDDGRLPSGMIRCLTTDRFGGVWVGTADAGAHRSSKWTQADTFHRIGAAPTGLNAVWSFLDPPSSSGAVLYVGTQNGIVAYAPDVPPRLVWNSRFPVRAMMVARQSRPEALWVGTLGGGVKRLEREGREFREVATYFETPNTDKESSVYALHRDRDGRIWIGSNGGGLRSLAGTPLREHAHPLVDGRDSATWVTAIREDKTGSLWVGTWKQGLWTRAAGGVKFKKVRPTGPHLKGLLSESVFCIWPDRDDPEILWLGTNGDGLWRYTTSTGDAVRFREAEGLPDNTIYAIVQDPKGLVWVSTNRGIATCDPHTLQIVRREGEGGSPVREYSLGACFVNRAGYPLFGTAGGFVECLQSPDTRAVPPIVTFGGYSKAGRDQFVVPGTGKAPSIEVDHGSWPVVLTFTALHFAAPGRNLYSYRIDGVDTAWSALTTDRHLDIPNLPAGTHTVRVRACTPEGVWSLQPFVVALVVAPAFWETRAVQVALVLAPVGLALVLWMLRRRRVRAREDAIRKEQARVRKRIATDFHDDFGARAARISMTAHLLNDGASTIDSDVAEQLHHLALDAQKLSREMREMTWELDPERDSLLDLAAYLKGYSDELFDATPIAFSLEGISRDLERTILPMEWRQQIGRIFKEGMTNALKHASGCRHVWLRFGVDRGVLRIELRDDGGGFGAVGVGRGNGLRNMRDRARSLHGELSIESCPGSGTTISLQVKLP